LGLGATASFVSAGQANAAPTKRRIKIGQIGTAHGHAEGKIATARKFADDFEFVGVVEPDPALRKAAQRRRGYRDAQWLTEEQLLNTQGLEVVCVETAVRDLVPTAARCIDAGVHIHLDKPPGESLGAFKRLLDAAARKRRVVQLGYMFRYNPAFQFCFRAVQEGWLGDVFELHGVISKTIDADSRKQLVAYQGGSMFELGCHLIDALVTVLGKPDKVTPYIRQTRPQQDSLRDNGLAVFEYPKATATIRSALVEVEGSRRRQFVVCGDKGTVDIRPLEPPTLLLALSHSRGEHKRGYQEIELPKLGGRYDGDFADLAKIVRGEKAPDWRPAHDLAVHEAVLRASGLPAE
jgi:predicted dehydrogenase